MTNGFIDIKILSFTKYIFFNAHVKNSFQKVKLKCL